MRSTRLDDFALHIVLALAISGVAAGCGSAHSTSDDAGAGGGDGPASCDMTVGTIHTCVDYSSISASLASVEQANCGRAIAPAGTTVTGVWSMSPCTQTGLLGSCAVTSGGITVTTRYYGSGTADSEQQACVMSGGTWTTP